MDRLTFSVENQVVSPSYYGLNAVYHGFSYMPYLEKAGFTEADREREFSRVDAMQLKIARTYFRPDLGQSGLLAFGRWAEKMKSLGVEIAVQCGWWFPLDVWYFAHERYNDRTLTDDAASFEEYCNKFAAWISKALEYFILLKKCTNIRYLMLFTEPTTTPVGNLPKGMTVQQAYGICCRKVDEKLRLLGIRDMIKLVGPNGIFLDRRSNRPSADFEPIREIADVAAYHTYAVTEGGNLGFTMSSYRDWLRHAQYLKTQFGEMPIWFDEFALSGKGSESLREKPMYGNMLAQAAAAFANGGLQNAFLWMLFDAKHNHNATNGDAFYHGIHRWGTAYCPIDSVPNPTAVRPSWYVVSLLSRYLCGHGEGKVLSSSFSDGICGCATEPEDGKTTVLLVNTRGVTVSVDVKSGGRSTDGFSLYLFDPSALPENGEMISGMPWGREENQTVVLPPYGVAVLSDFEGSRRIFPEPPENPADTGEVTNTENPSTAEKTDSARSESVSIHGKEN